MVTVENDSEVFDPQTIDSNGIAQTFLTPSGEWQTTKLRLYLETGEGGYTTFSIRATSLGLPTGEDLGSVQVNNSSMPFDDIFEMDINATLQGNTTYAIVAISSVGGAGYWFNTTNSYADGTRCNGSSGGTSWVAVGEDDLWFSLDMVPYAAPTKLSGSFVKPKKKKIEERNIIIPPNRLQILEKNVHKVEVL